MGKQTRHLIDEADIGSGEKTPAQHETDEMIEQLNHPVDNKPKGRDEQQPNAVRKNEKDQGPAANRH